MIEKKFIIFNKIKDLDLETKMSICIYYNNNKKNKGCLVGLYDNKKQIKKDILLIKKNIKRLHGFSINIKLIEYKKNNYFTIFIGNREYYFILYEYINNLGNVSKLYKNYALYNEIIRLNKYKITKNKKGNLIGYIHIDPHEGNFLISREKIIIIDYKNIKREKLILQPLVLFIRIYYNFRKKLNYSINKINGCKILYNILLYFCINIDGLILDLNNIDILSILEKEALKMEKSKFILNKNKVVLENSKFILNEYDINNIILNVNKKYYARKKL